MTETVKIGGLEVDVVTDAQAEEADIVVCMRKGSFSPFTDNVETTCSVCGADIIHRPYAPAKPPKVCLECALEMTRSTRQ